MRLVFIPCPGPVGVFRASMPASFLRSRGHRVLELHEQCGLDKETQEREIREADAVLYVGPGGRRCFDERPEAFCAMRGALLVELDDDYFAWLSDPASRDPVHAELAKAQGVEFTPERLENLRSWIQGAELVTTTTDYLASRLKAEGAQEVAICPNGLHPDWRRTTPRRGEVQAEWRERNTCGAMRRRGQKWGGAAPPPLPPARRVAWTGSIAHKEDVRTSGALGALRRLASADARLEVFSLGPIDFSELEPWKGFQGDYRRVISMHYFGYDKAGRKVAQAWQEAALEPGQAREVVSSGDGTDTIPFARIQPKGRLEWVYARTVEGMSPNVAILPMRESPFNRSKSPVTLLNWAITGTPVVCARTGPYAVEAERGFPAVFVPHDDEEAWHEALRDLLYDETKALELGDRALEWVLEHHTFPAAASAWESAFARAIEIKKARSS